MLKYVKRDEPRRPADPLKLMQRVMIELRELSKDIETMSQRIDEIEQMNQAAMAMMAVREVK